MEPEYYDIKEDLSGELGIFFGGDTLLGHSAKQLINDLGYEYPFLKLSKIYNRADVRVVNLESPVCAISKKITLEKQYIYKMSPVVLDAFEKHQFNIFMLANNHTTDCGIEGLIETLEHLKSRKLYAIGAGKHLEEARRGIIIRKGDINVGLLNYMHYKAYYMETLNHYASHNQGGVNLLTEDSIYEDIIRLRKFGASTVLVSIHWATNYKPINKEQKRLANLMIDAGADVIIGHGSHQYQPIRVIKGKPVFFSIGNFIFHTKGRSPLTYGFPMTIYVTKNRLLRAEIYPILTNNKIVNYQPIHLKHKDAIIALNELFTLSQLNYVVTSIRDDHGLILF